MKKVIAVSIFLFVTLFLASGKLLSGYGHFLVVNEKPQKCDAIVILGGETVPRVAEGVKLYREGYANLIIMSGGGQMTSKLSDADLMSMEARDLGVSPDVILLEKKSESTYENAVFVKDIVMNRNIKKFLLVTSNYHTRRARYIFEKVFKDSGVAFITVAAPDPKFSPDSWWKSDEGQQMALTELADLIVYLVKY